MATSLREKQIVALKRMLNFNVPVNKSTNVEPQWKVLIYDRFGQDIISPLLGVKDLRDMGVTLHLNLHSDRDCIPDVPAVYFVLPTDENVQRICRDLQNQLYDCFYFNFISAIPRQKLEDLASAAIHSNSVTQVSKVFDQYLNFISLEDDMFALRHQDRDSISYYAINRSGVKDTEMEQIMDTIVDSLFSVFVTLGTVPIIRCPRGNAAEMVAEKLDKKLRENLRDARNSFFTSDSIQAGQFSFQRPLLVLLDRNLDMATMLHHTWTYQALSHDVLDFKLNRVEIEEETEIRSPAGTRPSKKKKSYDMNATDRFWQLQKGNPFPTVAESVQEELDAYRAKEDEVKSLKAAMGIEGEDESAISMLSDNTAKLTNAVSSLPELLEQKRLIDMHTNIATALLEKIKSRKLDVYFETEEKLMSKAALDNLMDIISDPEAGLPEDKLRLFLIALICGPTLSDAQIDEYSKALQAANCDMSHMSTLQYIRRWKSYTKMTATPSQYGGGGTKTVNMFSKLMSHGSQFLMEGVKNLVIKKHNLPATRIVDALMEMKTMQDIEDYLYFDPKLLRANASIPRNKSPFQEAYVFVVGGGNYIEYQNLVDYAKGKSATSPKRVVYGCSDLCNASQFLKQLSHLGQES